MLRALRGAHSVAGPRFPLPPSALWSADHPFPRSPTQGGAHNVEFLRTTLLKYLERGPDSFEEFFPLVRPGGVYVVEDTMVDPAFLLFVHNLTVEMNSFSARRYGNFGWNCDDASVLAGKLGSIAFYDGILVVEKVDRSCYDAMPMNLP